MKPILHLSVLLMVFAGPVWSKTVQVRSGDHEGFTRLVLRIPPQVKWSLERGSERVAIRLDLENVTYDFSSVFRRIPRERLLDLQQAKPGEPLEMQLGCACRTRAFVQNSVLLVVDIFDDETDPDAPITFPPIAWPEIFDSRPYRFHDLGGTKQPKRDSIWQLTKSTDARAIRESEGTLPRSPALNIADYPLRNTQVSEQRLLAEFERAAAIGLLRNIPTLKETAGETVDSENDPKNVSAPNTDQSQARSDLAANMAFESNDIGGSERLTDLMSAFAIDRQCIETSRLALSDWSDGSSFGSQISDLRANLYQEFDRINIPSVVQLAQLYLFFGFGAEAFRVAEMLPPTHSEKPILEAMAQILDHGSLRGGSPFSGMEDCETEAAFWAFYANPQNMFSEFVNSKSVIKTYLRLPTYLQNYLAAQLSERFIEMGDLANAEYVLRAIQRLQEDKTTPVTMAEAALASERGNGPEVTELLESVIAAGAPESAMALVQLVDIETHQRGTVSPEIPDLIAAYAYELADSENGSSLRRAQALALALTGRFDEAFQTNDSIEVIDGEIKAGAVRADLLSLLAERADDATFVRLGLWRTEGREASVPAAVGLEVAERLLSLGFSRSAEALLSVPSSTTDQAKIRVLKSKVALDLGQPNSALTELAGMEDAEAAGLRARALWKVGDYAGAARTFQRSDEPSQADRAFWHAGIWDSVDYESKRGYGEAANIGLELRRLWGSKTEDTPLASARTLLVRSENARTGVERLLTIIANEPNGSAADFKP